MWSMAFDKDGKQPTGPHPFSPPDNEIPVVLPLTVISARTEDVAVALVAIRVYSTGWELEGVMRSRPSTGPSFFSSDGRDAEPYVGIEFADGRRGSTVAAFGRPYGETPAGGVLVQMHGGGGGPFERAIQWWINPVPPPGPMLVLLAAPHWGIEETSVTIDADLLIEARAQVVELWPWEAEPPNTDVPSPPVFPEGSWFRTTG